MNYCPHCGSQISDPTFTFCGSCGKSIAELTKTVPEIQPTITNPIPNPIGPGLVNRILMSRLLWAIVISFATIGFTPSNNFNVWLSIAINGIGYGFSLWFIIQSMRNTPKTPNIKRTMHYSVITFVTALLLSQIATISSQNKQSNKINKSSALRSPLSTEQSYQPSEPIKRMLASGFYENIGLSKSKLIDALGEPSEIQNNLFLYDDNGWRQMYGLKNNKVHSATYLEIGIELNEVKSRISDIVTEFKQNKFWRISDYDNIKRFSNGTYDISIMPIKTDDGKYNIGLMAFRK